MNVASGAASATPGVSLNFDVQALHDAEELEYQREEAERQNELKQLLTTAFDDLSDEDEDSQLTSANQSQISNDAEEDADESHTQNGDVTWQPDQRHLHHGFPLAHTSTPIMGPAPPLATPAPHYGSSAHPYNATQQQYWPQKHPIHDIHPYHQGAPSDTQQYHQGVPNTHVVHATNLPEGGGEERGETEGGNDAEHYFDPGAAAAAAAAAANGAPSQGGNYHQGAPPLPSQPPPHPPLHTQYDYGRTNDVGIYAQGHNYTQPHPGYYNDYFNHQGLALQENEGVFPLPYSPKVLPTNNARHPAVANPALDSYKVTYMGSSMEGASGGETSTTSGKPTVLSPGASQPPPIGTHQNEPSIDVMRPGSPVREYDSLQKEYLNQDGSPESRRLTQLNILYNARGRKIDELDRELKKTKEESDREIRILKHKVALAEDECKGVTHSLENAQQLVRDGQQHENELHGKISGLEKQLQSLQTAKEQYIGKLQTAESTIETLTEQLSQLGASDTLTRTRDQHAAVVAGMQSKYETQLLMLKEKIDSANTERDEKMTDIEKLKRQVTELTKSSEQMRIERADAINRLNKSLEESQRQCQQLIEAGTGQELSKMKIQIQEVIAGKSIAEDMNSALQEENRELREQVTMYESASQLGVFPGASSILPSTIHHDDSYTQLGIKPRPQTTLSQDTPDGSDPGNLTAEETLHGLKSELERCLSMYRNKRQQVTSLNDELRNTKSSLQEVQARLQVAERSAKDAQERLMEETAAGDTSVREIRLQKEVKGLTNERETLLIEIEELTKRIEEIATSEEQLKQANRELSAQMAEMVREFDEDKKEALDRCEETYRSHMETTKDKLTEVMRAEFEEETDSMKSKYEGQIQELTEELSSVQQELDDVKQMYVSVCEMKDKLEHEADATLQSRLQQELDKLSADLRKEKDEELEQMKLSLTSNTDVAVANARDKWMKEQRSAKEKEIEEQVAAAKLQWLAEGTEKNEAAIQDAVCTAERHWQHKWDTEMEHELESKLKEARQQWTEENKAVLEKELNKGLMAAKATWEQTELARAIEIERDKLMKSLNSQKSADQASLENEHRAALERVREECAAELEKVSECFQQEISSLENEKSELEKKLNECEEKWLAERESVIKEKDGERRRAIQEVQDQNETDYHNFLQEHHDTLNKALKAARLQFSQEMEDVTKKHKEELSKLKEKEEKLVKLQEEHEKDQVSTEAAWNEKLESLTNQHQEEKDALMVSHRENLFKALEEARARWQKKFEEALSETSEKGVNTSLSEMRIRHLSDEAKRSRQQLEELQQKWEEEESAYLQKLEEQEERWEEERRGFIEQVNERDALLQSADEHLEAEVNRLQKDLMSHHQQQINELRNAHNSELASTRAELDAQLAGLRVQIESSNKDDVEKQLKASKSQLKELEIQYTEEVTSLKKVIDSREKELRKMRKELEDIKEVVNDYDSQREEATQQVGDLQQQLEKVESQRQEAVDALQSSMADHSQVIGNYKDKQKDLAQKLHKAERKLRLFESTAQKQLTSMQESMEREHSVAMEKLKEKMMELRSNHVVAMDTLQQKHETEKKELEVMMAGVLSHGQLDGQDPSQTEDSAVAPITEMRSYYLNIIGKMRSDVLHHVSHSNERAALTVREEVIRDRQKTAKRLRKYYMKCLSRLLDMDTGSGHGMRKDEKLAFMENALDNLPDRDSSSSGTGHSGRSTGSETADVTTPRGAVTTSQPLTSNHVTSHASISDVNSGRYQNRNEQSHLDSHDSLMPSSQLRPSQHSHTYHSPRLHKPDSAFDVVMSPEQNVTRRKKDKVFSTDPSGSETESEFLHTGSSTTSGSFWCTRSSSSDRSKPRHPLNKKSDFASCSDLTDARSKSCESDQSAADGRTHVPRKTAGDYIRSYQSSLKSSTKKQGSGSHPSGTFDESELRKYYDIDVGVVSKSDRRRRDSGKQGQASLTKVNADTFVLTPTKQLGMHNSRSVGDVRQCGSESMKQMQVHGTLSDDALNTDTDPVPKNISSYRYKPLRNMAITPYTGHGPSKSQSVPDFAQAQESWSQDSEGHRKGMHRMATSASLEHNQSIDSITYEPSSQGSSRSHPAYVTGFHSKDEYAPLRLKTRNREGHHVSFNVTNIDLNESGSLSDNESVKSIVSSSSVSSFRQALKSKHSTSVQSSSSSKQPMKVAHSAPDPNSTYVKSPASTHKPIAMVTRHTQIPSPFLSKRK